MQRVVNGYRLLAYLLFFAPINLTFAGEILKEPLHYVVKDGMSLSQISLLLYGTEGHWQELADINKLSSPYLLHAGQNIQLRRAPKLSEADGKKKLLAKWRKRFHLPDITQDSAPIPDPARDDYAVVTRSNPPLAKTIDAKELDSSTPPATPPEELAKNSEKIEIPSSEVNLSAMLKERAERLEENKKPESRTAEQLLKEAKLKLESQDFSLAKDLFRQSRTLDPMQLESWLGEIRCLKAIVEQSKSADNTELAYIRQKTCFKAILPLKNCR